MEKKLDGNYANQSDLCKSPVYARVDEIAGKIDQYFFFFFFFFLFKLCALKQLTRMYQQVYKELGYVWAYFCTWAVVFQHLFLL